MELWANALVHYFDATPRVKGSIQQQPILNVIRK